MAPTSVFIAMLAANANATSSDLPIAAQGPTPAPDPNPNPNPNPNPKLLANLVARVTLAILGTLLCWAPLRVLSRNGEFAAAVLIATVCGLNFITVINSLMWRSDDWARWPSGRGLCDLEVYLLVPLDTAYAAAVFAVVRRLAAQMRLTAAGMPLPAASSRSRASLGVGGSRAWRERVRGVLGQAAVIFAIPLVQVVFTYFDLAQRFVVGTLVGCSAVYDNSLPKILVFDVPPAAFAIASVPYAYLTYTRYRTISNITSATLGPRNATSTARAHRTRRRLYGMCVAILTAYLPLQLILAAEGIRETATASGTGSPLQTYDFARIHSEVAGSSPEHRHAWSTILFVPSWLVPFHVMNQPYIAILTTGVVFAFFGLGDEAKEIYRGYARWWACLWSAALCRCCWWRRIGGEGDDDDGEEIGSPRQRRMIAQQQQQQHIVDNDAFGRRRHLRRGQYSISDESIVMDTIEMTAVKQDTSTLGKQRTKTHTQADPLPTTPKRTRTQIRPSQRNYSVVPELARPRSRRQHHHKNKKKQHGHARGDSEVTVGSALSVPPSPLESTAVIRPMIPPRGSSLRNAYAGARRFRLPSLAPSFTLATLPSVSSIISFGRRQRQQLQVRKRRNIKGKGKEKATAANVGDVQTKGGEDEWVECDDDEIEIAGNTGTSMTTATTESDVFGGSGTGKYMAKFGMGAATAKAANTNANADANTPRLGSPSKHRARAYHPLEPMPSSAMAMRFPPRHDSLSSISLRRLEMQQQIPSTSVELDAVATAVTRVVAKHDNNDSNNGDGTEDDTNEDDDTQIHHNYHRNSAAAEASGFSFGGGVFEDDGSDNNSWRMTSAKSVSVEPSSTFSSELPLPAPAAAIRPRSGIFVSSSPAPRSSPEQQQEVPHQPTIRSARSPVSPSIPIPTPVPVPVALAFRPARRRVLVRGDWDHGGGESQESDNTAGFNTEAGPDGNHGHDAHPHASHTMDLLRNGSDDGGTTPTRTLFPPTNNDGAPFIFTAGIDANTGGYSSSSINTSMRGGGASSPLVRTRTRAYSSEGASSEASTEVEFGMAVTGRLLRPSVIASGDHGAETETETGVEFFAPEQQQQR